MSARSEDTKDKIIEAASALFCEKGFHATTVSQICSQAQVNIAAINYHFSGKNRLYLAVWEKIIEQKKQHSQHIHSADLPAEKRLELYIEKRIGNFLRTGERRSYGKLLHWEMSNPTHLHDEIFSRFIAPEKNRFHELIHEISGNSLNNQQLHVIGFCIQAILRHVIEVHAACDCKKIFETINIEEEIALLKNTILQFALGGIARISDKEKK